MSLPQKEKVKCFDCSHAFITNAETKLDALCTNEKTNICNLSHTWNKNLRNSVKPRICEGFKRLGVEDL